MSKMIAFLFMIALFSTSAVSCSQETAVSNTESVVSEKTTGISEYLDLGAKYLSEGSYKEAIIAFTAAIDIDPNNIDAYSGRAEAYIFSGENEENLTTALADYEKILEFNDAAAEAYLGLADIYIRQRDDDSMWDILQIGLEKTNGNSDISAMLDILEQGGEIYDSQGVIRYAFVPTTDGKWQKYFYDSQGRIIEEWGYDSFGERYIYTIYEYSENMVKQSHYTEDGTMEGYYLIYLNDAGQPERDEYYYEDGTLWEYRIHQYDAQGNEIQLNLYQPDGSPMNYYQFEYDEAGNLVRSLNFDHEGNFMFADVYQYDENGNMTGVETEDTP